MLDSIRSGAQSFGVKIAFGIIILVFVFWGVGNFNDRDYSNVVAVVNGQPIVALEFEKAYRAAEEALMRANPGMTREDIARMHLGRQVLNELIQATLLAQEASRSGISASPREMRNAVAQIKIFQNDKGQFDPEAYKRVLAANHMTPAEYEKELSSQILRDKIVTFIGSPVWVDPDEAAHRFNYLRERRAVDYLFFPAAANIAKVSLNEDDLKTYYEDNKAEFAIPPRVNAAYIQIEPAALAEKDKISADTARARYERDKDKYAQPEQAQVAHILAPLPENADDEAVKAALARLENARKEISSGKDFGAVADAINDKNAAEKGGSIGWIGRGDTVPEFEAAVFALPVGEISQPVRTQYGLHLIKVLAKREAGHRPFEEVADEIYKELAHEEGSDKLHDALDNLIEDNILMKPLADSAAKYNLKASETGLMDKNGLMAKLGIDAASADALMKTPAGSPLDTALQGGDSYIIARVLSAEPEGVRPFAEASDEIKTKLTEERALAMAMEEAAKILASVENLPIDKIKSEYPGMKTSEPVERGGALPGFKPDAALVAEIFAEPAHKWLKEPARVTRTDNAEGAAIVYVANVMGPNEGEYEAVAEILANAARQERIEGLFGLFLGRLADNAKIEIVNPAIIDRTEM